MKTLLVIASLLIAAPAFSQTKVYMNRDLGQPLSPNRGTVTAEQLASLAAHQFRGGSFERPWDQAASTGSSPTSGPFSDYQNTIVPRRLDGSLWTDPQWASVTYLGYPYGSRSAGGGRTHRGRSGGRPPTAGHGASGRPSRR
jgi:hypothetical protein